jgi:peptidyl-tRNA hydrolase
LEQKLYVLVRSDLSKSQQAVQAGHAVAEFCKSEAHRSGWVGRDYTNLPWRWTNGTLVYLKVRDECELREWANKIDNHHPFYEPDIGNQMTAFAVLGDREGFDQLRLA